MSSNTNLASKPRASFGTRLQTVVAERGPLCVGIDPHPQLLQAWGLPVNVTGLREFAQICVSALGGTVALVKPQSAFFEEYGSEGIAVLEETLAGLRAAGTLSLLDVKRGDIGSTMAGYARAYLSDTSSLAADAITVSPFLGLGSLQPAFDLAAATGRGVFVLALTSNPEGREVQHARGERHTVAGSIVDGVRALNAPAAAAGEWGSIGMVVGATIGTAAHDLGLDLAGANAPLLAPGFGAQGAGPQELRDSFGGALGMVLPSSSREVLGAGPDPEALRNAARDTASRLS